MVVKLHKHHIVDHLKPHMTYNGWTSNYDQDTNTDDMRCKIIERDTSIHHFFKESKKLLLHRLHDGKKYECEIILQGEIK